MININKRFLEIKNDECNEILMFRRSKAVMGFRGLCLLGISFSFINGLKIEDSASDQEVISSESSNLINDTVNCNLEDTPSLREFNFLKSLQSATGAFVATDIPELQLVPVRDGLIFDDKDLFTQSSTGFLTSDSCQALLPPIDSQMFKDFQSSTQSSSISFALSFVLHVAPLPIVSTADDRLYYVVFSTESGIKVLISSATLAEVHQNSHMSQVVRIGLFWGSNDNYSDNSRWRLTCAASSLSAMQAGSLYTIKAFFPNKNDFSTSQISFFKEGYTIGTEAEVIYSADESGGVTGLFTKATTMGKFSVACDVSSASSNSTSSSSSVDSSETDEDTIPASCLPEGSTIRSLRLWWSEDEFRLDDARTSINGVLQRSNICGDANKSGYEGCDWSVDSPLDELSSTSCSCDCDVLCPSFDTYMNSIKFVENYRMQTISQDVLQRAMTPMGRSAGSIIELVCLSGYSMEGGYESADAGCKRGGSWVLPSVICRKDCTTAFPLESGQMILQGSATATQHGTKLTVSCNQGYSVAAGLKGRAAEIGGVVYDSIITRDVYCMDGTWSKANLQCYPECPRIQDFFQVKGYQVNVHDDITGEIFSSVLTTSSENPSVITGANSTLADGSAATFRLTFGSQTTISCAPGYSALSAGVQEETLICGPSGLWSTRRLDCQKNCKPFDVEAAGLTPSQVVVATNNYQQLINNGDSILIGCGSGFLMSAHIGTSTVNAVCAGGSWLLSEEVVCKPSCASESTLRSMIDDGDSTLWDRMDLIYKGNSHGSASYVQCKSGYQPRTTGVSSSTIADTETVMCTEGVYTSPALDCLPSCSSSPTVDSIYTIGSTPLNATTGSPLQEYVSSTTGSKRVVVCAEGYDTTVNALQLNTTQEEIICESTGQWSTVQSLQCAQPCNVQVLESLFCSSNGNTSCSTSYDLAYLDPLKNSYYAIDINQDGTPDAVELVLNSYKDSNLTSVLTNNPQDFPSTVLGGAIFFIRCSGDRGHYSTPGTNSNLNDKYFRVWEPVKCLGVPLGVSSSKVESQYSLITTQCTSNCKLNQVDLGPNYVTQMRIPQQAIGDSTSTSAKLGSSYKIDDVAAKLLQDINVLQIPSDLGISLVQKRKSGKKSTSFIQIASKDLHANPSLDFFDDWIADAVRSRRNAYMLRVSRLVSMGLARSLPIGSGEFAAAGVHVLAAPTSGFGKPIFSDYAQSLPLLSMSSSPTVFLALPNEGLTVANANDTFTPANVTDSWVGSGNTTNQTLSTSLSRPPEPREAEEGDPCADRDDIIEYMTYEAASGVSVGCSAAIESAWLCQATLVQAMANAGRRVPPGMPSGYEEFRQVCPITCGNVCDDSLPALQAYVLPGDDSDCIDNNAFISAVATGFTCSDVVSLQGMTVCGVETQTVFENFGFDADTLPFSPGDASAAFATQCPVTCGTCPSQLLLKEQLLSDLQNNTLTTVPQSVTIAERASEFAATQLYVSSYPDNLQVPHGSEATITCATGFSMGSSSVSTGLSTDLSEDGDGGAVTTTVEISSSDILTCHEGAWTARSLYCARECPSFSDPGNAYVVSGDATDTRHGALRTVTCATGAAAVDGVDEQIVRCLDGSWTDLVMDCRQSCSSLSLPTPVDGVLQAYVSAGVSDASEDARQQSHGARWSYTCATGYTPHIVQTAVAVSNLEEVKNFETVGGSPYVEPNQQIVNCHDGRWSILSLRCFLSCNDTALPDISRFRFSFIEGKTGTNRTRVDMIDQGILVDNNGEDEIIDPAEIDQFWLQYTINGAAHNDYIHIECQDNNTAANPSSNLPASMRVNTQDVKCVDGKWDTQTLICKRSCAEFFYSDDDPKQDSNRYITVAAPGSATYPSAKLIPHGSRRVFKCNESYNYFSTTAASASYAVCVDGVWTKPGLQCKKSCPTPVASTSLSTNPMNSFPPTGYCVWDNRKSRCVDPHDYVIQISDAAQKKLIANDTASLSDGDITLYYPKHGEEMMINCADGFSPVSGSSPTLVTCNDGFYTPFWLICAPNCLADDVKTGNGYRVVKTARIDALTNGYTATDMAITTDAPQNLIASSKTTFLQKQRGVKVRSKVDSFDPFSIQRQAIQAANLHASFIAKIHGRYSSSSISQLSHNPDTGLSQSDLDTELAAVKLSLLMSSRMDLNKNNLDGINDDYISLVEHSSQIDHHDKILEKLKSLRDGGAASTQELLRGYFLKNPEAAASIFLQRSTTDSSTVSNSDTASFLDPSLPVTVRNNDLTTQELEDLLAQIQATPTDLPVFYESMIKSALEQAEKLSATNSQFTNYTSNNSTELGLVTFPVTHGTRLTYECETWAAPLPGTAEGNSIECFWGGWTALSLRCVPRCNIQTIQQQISRPYMVGRYLLSYDDKKETEKPGGKLTIDCSDGVTTRWPPLDATESSSPAEMICSGGVYGSIPISCYKVCGAHPFDALTDVYKVSKSSDPDRVSANVTIGMLLADQPFLENLKLSLNGVNLEKWVNITNGGHSYQSSLLLSLANLSEDDAKIELEKIRLQAVNIREKASSAPSPANDELFQYIFNSTVNERLKYGLEVVDKTVQAIPYGDHGSTVAISCASGYTLAVLPSADGLGSTEIYSACIDGLWVGGNIKCFNSCPLVTNPDTTRYMLRHADEDLKQDYIDMAASSGNILSTPSATFRREHGFELTWSCVATTRPIYTQIDFISKAEPFGAEVIKCNDGAFEPLSLRCEKTCISPVLQFKDSKWKLKKYYDDQLIDSPFIYSGAKILVQCNTNDEYYDNSELPDRSEEIMCANGVWESPSLDCRKACITFGTDLKTVQYGSVAMGYESYGVRPPGYWSDYNSENEKQQSANSIQSQKEYRLHGAMRIMSCASTSSPLYISDTDSSTDDVSAISWEGDSIPIFGARSKNTPVSRSSSSSKPKKLTTAQKKNLEYLDNLVTQQAIKGESNELVNATSAVGLVSDISQFPNQVQFHITGEDAIVCKDGNWVGRMLICKRKCGEFVHPNNLLGGSKRYTVLKPNFNKDATGSLSEGNLYEDIETNSTDVIQVPQLIATQSILVNHGTMRMITCADGYLPRSITASIYYSASNEPFSLIQCADGVWSVPDIVCEKKCSEPYPNVIYRKCVQYHETSANSPCIFATPDLSIKRVQCARAMCDEQGGPWLGGDTTISGASPYLIYQTILGADSRAFPGGTPETSPRQFAAAALKSGDSHVVMCNAKANYAAVLSNTDNAGFLSPNGNIAKEVAVVQCNDGEWTELPFECDKGCVGAFDLYSHPRQWLPVFTNDPFYYTCGGYFNYTANSGATSIDLGIKNKKKPGGPLAESTLAGSEVFVRQSLGRVQTVSCKRWMETANSRVPASVHVNTYESFQDNKAKVAPTTDAKKITDITPTWGYKWPMGEHWAIWGPGCCSPGNCWSGTDPNTDRGLQCQKRIYGRGAWVAFEGLVGGVRLKSSRDVYYARCDVGVRQPDPVFEFVGQMGLDGQLEKYDLVMSYPRAGIVSDTGGARWQWSMPALPLRYFMPRYSDSQSSETNSASDIWLKRAVAKSALMGYYIEVPSDTHHQKDDTLPNFKLDENALTWSQKNTFYGQHLYTFKAKLSNSTTFNCTDGAQIVVLDTRVGPLTALTGSSILSGVVSSVTPYDYVATACDGQSTCTIPLTPEGLGIPGYKGVASSNSTSSSMVQITAEAKMVYDTTLSASSNSEVNIVYLCTTASSSHTMFGTDDSTQNALVATDGEQAVIKAIMSQSGSTSTTSTTSSTTTT